MRSFQRVWEQAFVHERLHGASIDASARTAWDIQSSYRAHVRNSIKVMLDAVAFTLKHHTAVYPDPMKWYAAQEALEAARNAWRNDSLLCYPMRCVPDSPHIPVCEDARFASYSAAVKALRNYLTTWL